MFIATPAFATPVRAPHAWFKPKVEGRINVNQASAQQLALLPGIGPATAAKIIAYRERQPFTRPQQLMQVKGIGKKTYAAIMPFITLSGDTTLRTTSEPPSTPVLP
jgi:competence protein ComEA